MKKNYKYMNKRHITLKDKEDYNFLVGILQAKMKNFEKDPYVMKNLTQLKDMIDAMMDFLKREQ